MKKTINLNNAEDLQPGDFLTVQLREAPETVISGKVIKDDNGHTHISGYGWIDVARHKFIKATRELEERESEYHAGTLGRAMVTVSGITVRVNGVITRDGDFRWAGTSGEYTTPNGKFYQFEPISFTDLENTKRHLQTLKESITRVNENLSDLRSTSIVSSNELEVTKADRDQWRAEANRLNNKHTDLLMDLNSLKAINGLERSMATKEGSELQKHFEQMNYEEQSVVLPSFLEIAGAVGEVLYQKNKWILGAPSKVDVGDAVLNLLKKKMTVLTVENLATFIDEVMQEESIVGDPMTIAEGVYERLGLARGTNATN